MTYHIISYESDFLCSLEEENNDKGWVDVMVIFFVTGTIASCT